MYKTTPSLDSLDELSPSNNLIKKRDKNLIQSAIEHGYNYIVILINSPHEYKYAKQYILPMEKKYKHVNISIQCNDIDICDNVNKKSNVNICYIKYNYFS
jgi:hypothetical protein